MSSSLSGQSSSNLKSILDTALINYKKMTKKGLLDHSLATEVQRCDSVDDVLATLQRQANAFSQSRGDQHLMKWIRPVVNILYASCDTLGGADAVRSRNPMRAQGLS